MRWCLFTGDKGHARLDEGFAGDSGLWVLLQDGVEDGIGNLIGNLVRVSLGHGLRGKQKGITHWNFWLMANGAAHCTAMADAVTMGCEARLQTCDSDT